MPVVLPDAAPALGVAGIEGSTHPSRKDHPSSLLLGSPDLAPTQLFSLPLMEYTKEAINRTQGHVSIHLSPRMHCRCVLRSCYACSSLHIIVLHASGSTLLRNLCL